MLRSRIVNCNETVDGHLRRKDFLTPNEIKKLLSAAKDGRNGRRDSQLFLTMYRHGLRVSEALQLRVEDIDFEQRRIQVRRSKNGLSTSQPVEGDELRGFRALLRDRKSGWVFLSERSVPDKPMARQAVNDLLKKAGERIGIKQINPHMLRHSCGYYLANKGVDIRVIQDYLGHKSIEHTARYTRTAAVRFEGLWK